MPNTRSILLIALIFVGYLLWQQWEQDYGLHSPALPATSTTTSAPANASNNSTPLPTRTADNPTPLQTKENNTFPTSADTAGKHTATLTSPSPGQFVEVSTDVLKITIDTRNGRLTRADLLAYPIKPNDASQMVRLLNDAPDHYFVAEWGLVSKDSPVPDQQTSFQAEHTHYELDTNAKTLEVPLTWQHDSGVTIRQLFVFKRGSYEIEQRTEIRNNSPAAWTGNAFHELQRLPPQISSGGFWITNPEQMSFTGAAWYSPEKKFEKLAFDKFATSRLRGDIPKQAREISDGWISLLQHYFLAAWIPSAGERQEYSTGVLSTSEGTVYVIGAKSPLITVPSQEAKQTSARLYVGPKLQNQLATVAPGFELTTDYGMFTVIAQPLFHYVLSPLHALTGNWGWAIVLVTLLIKIAFYKLSEAQYRSMAKMRKFQPRLEALKERYADDKQKLQQAMLELYKKEKINPMGGCLPMLVQIPVFIALYWVLVESVELRHAPFIGWIKNLSVPDPYFVLPILNGLATLATQYLSPTVGMDPTQAKMMKIMPVIFAIMFAFFPAGLVLYWTVNGILSLIQQWVITKRIEAGEKSRR